MEKYVSSFLLQVRNSRALMKGEEITRSYIDPLNSKAEREKLLKVRFCEL